MSKRVKESEEYGFKRKKLQSSSQTQSQKKKPTIKSIKFIACTSNFEDAKEVIQNAADLLGYAQFQGSVDERTTQLVAFSDDQDFTILRACILGVPIVKFDWISDSLQAQTWLDASLYHVHKFTSDIQLLNRHVLGSAYKNKLFANLKFYLHKTHEEDNENTKEIIISCHGAIVPTIKYCQYAVTETKIGETITAKNAAGVETPIQVPTFNLSKERIVQVTPNYITDCVVKRQLLNTKLYKPK